MTFFVVLSWIFGIIIILWFIDSKPKSTQKSKVPQTPIVRLPIVNIPIVQNDSAQLANWKSRQKQEILSKRSVSELVVEKGINEIRYFDLINTREWHLKRLNVLIRDKYRCQDCRDRNQQHLQVHHNYYLTEKLPWDIDNSALVTLCRNHHTERHNGKLIKVYKKVNGYLRETINQNIYCDRCSGMGYLPQFSHVQAGICFKCFGDCITRSIFSNQLRWVVNSNISYQIDDILRSVNQDYYNLYLAQIDTTANSTSIVVNDWPFDDLPF